MEKVKKMTGKLGNMFRTSGTRNGSYSVGLTVIVIAIVIVLNLVVGQLPESVRNIDVSSTKILLHLPGTFSFRRYGRRDLV